MSQEKALRLKQEQDKRFVKMGSLIALSSGVTFGIHTALLGVAMTFTVATGDIGYMVWYLVIASANELLACMWLSVNNVREGRFQEVFRSFKTFPGKMACVGGILGGPIANGAYLLGIAFAGATYAVPITALKAVISALLAAVFLKQKIKARIWLGVAICIIGAIIIYYTPPEGNPENFVLGLIFALIAAAGWGIEGMLAAYGSAVLDTKATINLRYIASTIVFIFVLQPLIGGVPEFIGLLPQINGMLLLTVAAGFAGLSFLQWYKGNSMCGVAKGAAINGTYPLWTIVFTMIVTLDLTITPMVAIGAVVIVIGATIVSLGDTTSEVTSHE
ncbi:MAG: DMT family transporter [Turicibacter sp.]|nr:DMT family transporter [Turicibacter sp.]